MGMKKKRLIYVRKFGNKFAAWLKGCKKVVAPVVEPEPVIEPEPVVEPEPAPVVEPEPVLWSVPSEPVEEKE